MIFIDTKLIAFNQVRVYLYSAVSPLQYIANMPGTLLDSMSGSLATRQQLKRENEVLKQQLLLNRADQLLMESLAKENTRLRALLGSPVRHDSRKLVAEIMAVDSDPFSHQVVIDKGQLDGNPYAPSYFGGQGTGSGGVGYGLNGRGRASFKKLTQDCNESGMVIVRIVVNRSGNVIEAVPGVKGTTNTAQCLLDPAKKIALSHKWPSDSKAPSRQIGFVSVNFKISE